jgi:hypothetical protein
MAAAQVISQLTLEGVALGAKRQPEIQHDGNAGFELRVVKDTTGVRHSRLAWNERPGGMAQVIVLLHQFQNPPAQLTLADGEILTRVLVRFVVQ